LSSLVHSLKLPLVAREQNGNLFMEKKSFEEKVHTYERDMFDVRQESEALLSMETEKTFKKLKPKQRMLLWLAYVEGYSYTEISEMTSTKKNSLKVQLFRAREKMATLLREKEKQGELSHE
jgi:RNA polymerase sigma factor (sigma-70 family)